MRKHFHKVFEKKKITSENKLKKVKKTKFGYIWSFLVIGFCVFLAYEFWITKEGFVVLVDKVAGYDLGAYYFFHLSFAAFLFFMVLLQLMTKEDQKNIDGCAVVLMGGRLALVFLNIIGFGDLGIGVKRIVVLLILGFLFVCWKVGTELINCRCYDYEQQ